MVNKPVFGTKSLAGITEVFAWKSLFVDKYGMVVSSICGIDTVEMKFFLVPW